MKYVMNGGLLVGSRDGANLEIEREIGTGNGVFMFGSDRKRLSAYIQFMKNNKMTEGASHIDS